MPQPQGKLKYAGNSTKPGNPLWNEYIDEQGSSTLTVVDPVTVWEGCQNNKHFFVPIDSNGNIQCEKCGFGQRIIWGMQKLKRGKIIQLTPPIPTHKL